MISRFFFTYSKFLFLHNTEFQQNQQITFRNSYMAISFNKILNVLFILAEQKIIVTCNPIVVVSNLHLPSNKLSQKVSSGHWHSLQVNFLCIDVTTLTLSFQDFSIEIKTSLTSVSDWSLTQTHAALSQ